METNSSAARFGFARRVSRLRSTRTEVGWSWHHPSPLILSLSKDCSFLCAVADDARRTRAVLRQAQHEQSGVGWGGTGLAPSTTARPWRSFHFPTHAPKAYPPNRPVWLQPDRMDLPAMTVFGRAGAGDDRRGRPGITSRTFAKQVRHVCASFRRVFSWRGDIGWRHQISTRYLDLPPAPSSPGTKCGNPAPVISPLSTPAAPGRPGTWCIGLHSPNPAHLEPVEGLLFLCAVAHNARRTRAVLRQAQHEREWVFCSSLEASRQ